MVIAARIFLIVDGQSLTPAVFKISENYRCQEAGRQFPVLLLIRLYHLIHLLILQVSELVVESVNCQDSD